MKKISNTNRVEWIVKVSMLSAVATVLMLLEFPLPFIAPPFYELDISEVPVLLGAFALGPVAGVVIETIKILLNLVINGTITAGVGECANWLMGVALVFPASIIYHKNKCKKNAILGLICGSLLMVILGGFVNVYILIPTYGKALGISMDEFVNMGAAIHSAVDSIPKMALLCVVPFNILKSIIVSVVTMLIYKKISPILKFSGGHGGK